MKGAPAGFTSDAGCRAPVQEPQARWRRSTGQNWVHPDSGISQNCIEVRVPEQGTKASAFVKQAQEKTLNMTSRNVSPAQAIDSGDSDAEVNIAPKRYHAAAATHTGETARAPASTSATSVDQLAAMFQIFLIQRQERDEIWRKEAGKQEQRWRSLQHQFTEMQQVAQIERRPAAAESKATEQDIRTRTLRYSGETTRGEMRVYASSQDRLVPHAAFRPTPRLPELKVSDDIENYLAMFERVAQTAGWPPEDWAIHLVPALEGKAREAYVTMDAADIGNYVKVKEAILQKYEINRDTYRQRFRNSSIRPNETPKKLHCRLKGLYEKWMRPEEKSKQEISDAIVLEQFLKVLSPELRCWIIERSPESTVRAVELAEAFITARQSEGAYGFDRGRSNQSAEKPGRSRGDFGKGLDAYAKRSNVENRWLKHKTKMSYNSGSGSEQQATNPVCFNCGQLGHKSRECLAVDSSTNKLCYIAKPDRNIEAVPNNETVISVKIGKRTVKALIDTGASQTLVTKQSLPESQVFQNSKLRVKCVHGDERVYPTADVRMEIAGQAYILKVGVMEKLPYGVILGRDVPILLDLLYESSATVEVNIVTRQQAKQAESAENRQMSEQLPYNSESRRHKSKREKRQAKVKGTRVEERVSRPSFEETKFPGDIGDMQRNDETLQKLFDKASQHTHQQNGEAQWVLQEGKLYRIREGQQYLVIPKALRAEILDLAHTSGWAGHMGQSKTTDRITDGMTERFNKTLKEMLKKFVSDTGSDWEVWLPYLLFAYWEVPQSSSGFSPFELVFSQEEMTVKGMHGLAYNFLAHA
ncbi:hypothetical protein SRHO_G00160150 [Serrasalmus rhombeus]